jgi:hypothetical protein
MRTSRGGRMEWELTLQTPSSGGATHRGCGPKVCSRRCGPISGRLLSDVDDHHRAATCVYGGAGAVSNQPGTRHGRSRAGRSLIRVVADWLASWPVLGHRHPTLPNAVSTVEQRLATITSEIPRTPSAGQGCSGPRRVRDPTQSCSPGRTVTQPVRRTRATWYGWLEGGDHSGVRRRAPQEPPARFVPRHQPHRHDNIYMRTANPQVG